MVLPAELNRPSRLKLTTQPALGGFSWPKVLARLATAPRYARYETWGSAG